MIYRISSPVSETGSGPKRLSMNNPFRASAIELGLQSSDNEFHSWATQNNINFPYNTNRRATSQISFTGSRNSSHHSMSPPAPRPASNNPFLDDVQADSAGNSFDLESSGNSSGNRSQNGNRIGSGDKREGYPSAQEEKERLRNGYVEQRYVEEGFEEEDLPPSYEEVAGRSGYGREKSEGESGEGRYAKRGGKGVESGCSRSRQEVGGGNGGSRSGKVRSHHVHSSSGTQRPSFKDRKNGHHHHSSGEKEKRSGSSGKKDKSGKGTLMPKNVDTIDKLDVTGLFGGAFHHDGPFDACTPHRNKNNKVAPVLAFPKDGPNSTLAGAPPAANKAARNEVFGLDEDDDTYLYTSKRTGGAPSTNASSATIDAIKIHPEVTQFDAKVKADLVHGPTTQGLGSTTFLDGAPAAPIAIEEAMQKQNAVGRKKSLSKRLAKSPPTMNSSGPSAEAIASRRSGNPKLKKSQSAVLADDEIDVDEDEFYLSPLPEPDARKESSGNKFLRRVKSLKVSRRG
ncbi:Pal1 family protein Ecym_1322 [Eremothecium cymbalariae DBVPG|uniref:Peptidase S59 domain-containing protein n=1 Tax=Eremothecium cymbalariae (strain CBS 270.75 / DBVPG 7215 / KCTC 17166 / NRRL Y-17582) TaxID=931890 RepID=G8JN93_ERECY|nr:hypothetical protein Ecym_1322 [Eremothecium cymbalariae DBVPG\